MAELLQKNDTPSFTANILIKKEDGMFVAHCLELDIVAVSDTVEGVQKEMVSLVCAQIDYAFSSNNLDNLYHPAPADVWQEFYKCQRQEERKYDIKSAFKKSDPSRIIPPWLITKTCNSGNNVCYA